jgi:hypothetical protein
MPYGHDSRGRGWARQDSNLGPRDYESPYRIAMASEDRRSANALFAGLSACRPRRSRDRTRSEHLAEGGAVPTEIVDEVIEFCPGGDRTNRTPTELASPRTRGETGMSCFWRRLYRCISYKIVLKDTTTQTGSSAFCPSFGCGRRELVSYASLVDNLIGSQDMNKS